MTVDGASGAFESIRSVGDRRSDRKTKKMKRHTQSQHRRQRPARPVHLSVILSRAGLRADYRQLGRELAQLRAIGGAAQ